MNNLRKKNEYYFGWWRYYNFQKVKIFKILTNVNRKHASEFCIIAIVHTIVGSGFDLLNILEHEFYFYTTYVFFTNSIREF